MSDQFSSPSSRIQLHILTTSYMTEELIPRLLSALSKPNPTSFSSCFRTFSRVYGIGLWVLPFWMVRPKSLSCFLGMNWARRCRSLPSSVSDLYSSLICSMVFMVGLESVSACCDS